MIRCQSLSHEPITFFFTTHHKPHSIIVQIGVKLIVVLKYFNWLSINAFRKRGSINGLMVTTTKSDFLREWWNGEKRLLMWKLKDFFFPLSFLGSEIGGKCIWIFFQYLANHKTLSQKKRINEYEIYFILSSYASVAFYRMIKIMRYFSI